MASGPFRPPFAGAGAAGFLGAAGAGVFLMGAGAGAFFVAAGGEDFFVADGFLVAAGPLEELTATP